MFIDPEDELTAFGFGIFNQPEKDGLPEESILSEMEEQIREDRLTEDDGFDELI